LQIVQELIDLLDSLLGKPNDYSRRISAYYSQGVHNMHQRPSLQSVREIVALVKAAQTFVKRALPTQSGNEEEREMEYDVMEVCLNGHKITGSVKSEPFRHENFCKECGEKTISACQSCNSAMRGDRHIRGNRHFAGQTISADLPRYCIECGSAYPWQVAGVENFKQILRESQLGVEDLQEAEATLPDIVRNTPKTESSSLKLKRIMGKVGKPIYDVAIKVITDIASESAKKTLGLS
jgi:hypothetical protein